MSFSILHLKLVILEGKFLSLGVFWLDLSGFSYLSICRGVITMLTRDSLVASEEVIIFYLLLFRRPPPPTYTHWNNLEIIITYVSYRKIELPAQCAEAGQQIGNQIRSHSLGDRSPGYFIYQNVHYTGRSALRGCGFEANISNFEEAL